MIKMKEEKEKNNNQLPKDWKWVKLGEVCRLKNGFAFKSTEYKDEGIAVIRISDIKYETVKPDKSVRVNEEKDYDNYVVKSGEILVAMSGATTGKFGIYKSLEKAYQNQRVGKFKILNKEKLHDEFLLYQLHALKRQIEKDAYGGAQPNISSGKIEAMEILLPPKPTQQAIVSKIEELFSELDKGIENLHTAQQQLKTYRQSVLKWAFEGKLTNSLKHDLPAGQAGSYDLHDEHDLNIAAEPGIDYKAKKNQGNQDNPVNHGSDKGELPKGWKMVYIEDVANVGTGATPLKSKPEYYGGNIPWVTSGALNEEYVKEATDFVTEKAIKETNLSIYPKHTLLVAMYGEGKTRGKCSELLIEACTNQAIAALSFAGHDVSIKTYLKYFLLKNYNDVRKKSSGGVQPNLNLGIIKKIKFPLAPVEEQRNIVQAIESRLNVADKMEESITQSLQQTEALRQSILKKAFEGKLVY